MANVTKQSQQNYEANKRHPKSDYLTQIASIGADVLYILTGHSTDHVARQIIDETFGKANREAIAGLDAAGEPGIDKPLDQEKFALISIHDTQLAAGTGKINWEEGAISELAFNRTWLRRQGINPAKASLAYIDGDSMEPTLKHGAIIMIDRNRSTPRDRRIYVFRQGDKLRVKRLEVTNGQLLAVSDNPRYRTEILSPGVEDDFEIIGEVVWSAVSVMAAIHSDIRSLSLGWMLRHQTPKSRPT